MAKYQIMYWKDIPNVVKVWDDQSEKKVQLSSRFALAIDAAAVNEAEVEADVYLDAWHWSEVAERPGEVAEVVQMLVDELEAAWPRTRLAARVRREMLPEE
mgnify:CR=1 FL=1